MTRASEPAASRRRRIATALVLAAAGVLAGLMPPVSVAQEPGTVIFLVRHAEAVYPPPEDAPRNPPLNVMGQSRAEALARLLEPAGIDHVHSSDYRRTQETAAPLAARLGLSVQSYDPRALEPFAEQLRATPGRHVVLGHSNTTPALVGFLGGEPGEPINERIEYDRLYILTIDGSDNVTTIVQRYGDPLPENWEELSGQRR